MPEIATLLLHLLVIGVTKVSENWKKCVAIKMCYYFIFATFALFNSLNFISKSKCLFLFLGVCRCRKAWVQHHEAAWRQDTFPVW